MGDEAQRSEESVLCTPPFGQEFSPLSNASMQARAYFALNDQNYVSWIRDNTTIPAGELPDIAGEIAHCLQLHWHAACKMKGC